MENNLQNKAIETEHTSTVKVVVSYNIGQRPELRQLEKQGIALLLSSMCLTLDVLLERNFQK